MKRVKQDTLLLLPKRLKLLQIFMALMLLYSVFTTFEIETPLAFRTGFVSVSSLLETEHQNTHHRKASLHQKPMQELQKVSTLCFNEALNDTNVIKNKFSKLHMAARDAWIEGKRIWEEVQSVKTENVAKFMSENLSDTCNHSISLSGSEFREQKGIMVLPCGLTMWSHVTVVGTPRWGHWEHHHPKISVVKDEDEMVMVSQFMMELLGLKADDKEEPPKILHFNPKLKGDWSGRPVIEQNTCFRMQCGSPLRCEGWKSRADDDTGD